MSSNPQHLAAAQRGAAEGVEAPDHVLPGAEQEKSRFFFAGLFVRGRAEEVHRRLPGAHGEDPARAEAAGPPAGALEQEVYERGLADALFTRQEKMPFHSSSNPLKYSGLSVRERTSQSTRP